MTTGGLYVLEDTVGAVEIYDAYDTVIEILETVTEIVEIVTPELVGPQGPPGIQGVNGPAGPRGDPGPVGPFPPTFRQEFQTASDIWVINHGLNEYPVVDLYDFDGSEIGGDVTMPDKNTVVVTFDFPVSGFAVLKA